MVITATEIFKWTIFFVAGMALNQLLQTVRGRMSTLRWQVNHFPLAISGDSPDIGKLEISFNGQPCRSLHSTIVTIKNDSGRDLKDIEIGFRFVEGNIIYYQKAYVEGTSWALEVTDGFRARLERVEHVTGKEDDGAVDAERALAIDLLRHRDYQVPALNRGGVITATFLMHTEGNLPFVEVLSPSSGIRVVQKPVIAPLRNEFFGIAVVDGLKLGVPVNIGLLTILYQYIQMPWLIVIAVLTTHLSALIGIYLIRIYKGIVSLVR